MKKIILIVFTALLVWACGNKTQFTLSGEVVPATDGKMILFGFDKGNPVAIDSAEIVGGKFTFTGEVEIPQLRLIGIEGQNRYIAQLFVDPAKINMTIYPDSFSANVITGSKTQDIFQLYMDEVISFSKAEQELQGRYRNAQATGDSDEMDAVRFEYETMMDNTKLYAKNFISEYSESPAAAYVYLMNFFQDATGEELDSILTVFESIKESEFVSVLQDKADALKASGVGAAAPDFTIDDPDGNPIVLSSLKGKYVLIDFWASWCQPCMMELPNVIEQYAAYKDKGFEIVGISLDRGREPWLNTIKQKEMSWLQGWDEEGAIATKYGVSTIPHTVLLDKEGNIIEKDLRGPALKEKLAELLD